MALDPALKFDSLRIPAMGHALNELIKDSGYDWSGCSTFETEEEYKELKWAIINPPPERMGIDKWTGEPLNIVSAEEAGAPSFEEVKAKYDEYMEEYNAAAGKRERVRHYPEIKEQLDMLYHDIDNGLLGDQAKESNFYTTIKEIKDTYQ
jgi:hypothetical protein